MYLFTFAKYGRWAIFQKGPATIDRMPSQTMRGRWKGILLRSLEWLAGPCSVNYISLNKILFAKIKVSHLMCGPH